MLSVALALWLQDWYRASKSSAPRLLSPSPASSCRTSRTWPVDSASVSDSAGALRATASNWQAPRLLNKLLLDFCFSRHNRQALSSECQPWAARMNLSLPLLHARGRWWQRWHTSGAVRRMRLRAWTMLAANWRSDSCSRLAASALNTFSPPSSPASFCTTRLPRRESSRAPAGPRNLQATPHRCELLPVSVVAIPSRPGMAASCMRRHCKAFRRLPGALPGPLAIFQTPADHTVCTLA